MKGFKSLARALYNIVLRPAIRLYQNISIRYKLLLVLNILIIVPLAGLSYMNYKNSEESLTRKSTQYTQDILKMIDMRLNDYIENLDITSQELLPDERVALSINNYTMISESLQVFEEAFRIENRFKKIILTHDEIQSIALISQQGKYHPADRSNRLVSIKSMVPYKSYLYEKILEKARGKNGAAVFYLDNHGGRVKNLFLARMVYNTDSFEELGLMIFLLRTDYLHTIFRDLVNEDMQNIMILSDDLNIIVDRDTSQSEDVRSLLSEISKPNGWQLDHTGRNIISYNVMEGEPGWKIASIVSLKNLYRDIDALRRKIIYSAILIVIVLSAISLLMTSDFVRPFKVLVSGMQRVQKGEKNVLMTFNRKDEIGYLGDAFNNMVSEMNTLSNWAYQEQLTRKEAELKALQSQINPHFLFNTLESINWMAQLNQVPEISQMVTALSSLMEASIGRDDKLISIREEVSYVDNYCFIMKRRFGDRMVLLKEIDDEALNVMIPRLLIQPLVENAVRHGIENNQERGNIRLAASVSGDKLTVVVENDGEGIRKDELALINETLSMDDEHYFKYMQGKKTKSVGLVNVNRRIKLFYGEHYGLTIESEEGRYTRVIVLLPLENRKMLLEKGVS